MEKKNSSDSQLITSSSTSARRRGIVPISDLELRDVAMRVAAAWKASDLKLAYITSEAFEQSAVEYAVLMDERLSLGAGRRPLTSELQQLDREVNLHLANVKHYLADIYGKERGQRHYPEFGIERIGKSYQLPIDRNERRAALERLVAALPKHGLTTQRYGLAYWSEMASRYNALMYQTGSTDSALSARVRDKNELKAEIRQVLQSMVLLVQANYPQNWRQVLRQWGFHLEKS